MNLSKSSFGNLMKIISSMNPEKIQDLSNQIKKKYHIKDQNIQDIINKNGRNKVLSILNKYNKFVNSVTSDRSESLSKPIFSPLSLTEGGSNDLNQILETTVTISDNPNNVSKLSTTSTDVNQKYNFMNISKTLNINPTNLSATSYDDTRNLAKI